MLVGTESYEGDLQSFRALLEEHGLPIQQWTGEKGTKTPEDLFNEVTSGESELEMDKDGTVLRITNVVAIDVIYHDKRTGKSYRLVEDRQVYKIDGSVRKRPMLHGAVTEKVKAGEDLVYAVARGLQEELGITRNFEFGNETFTEEIRVTQTYPGLRAKYRLHGVTVEIEGADFNPNGYIEDQPKKLLILYGKKLRIKAIF